MDATAEGRDDGASIERCLDPYTKISGHIDINACLWLFLDLESLIILLGDNIVIIIMMCHESLTTNS